MPGERVERRELAEDARQVLHAVDDRRGVEQRAQDELGRALQVGVEHAQRRDEQAETHEEDRLQQDRDREPAGCPSRRCAPATMAKSTSTGSEQRNSMPLLSTIRLTQIERGMAVDRTRRASLLNARVKSETDELNHTHGSSAVMRKTMYGSWPTAALEDLREHEPVDRAHHERVEHRPEVPERARGVADLAGRAPRAATASGGSAGAIRGRRRRLWSRWRVYRVGALRRPSWLFHIDSAEPIAMCMSRYW